MKKVMRRLAAVVVLLASITAVILARPAVSSAQCDNGWWDPIANACRPSSAPPPSRVCGGIGYWWDPIANICWPPAIPPA
jgi:hypothetical protein